MKKTFLHLSDTHFRRAYPAADSGYLSIFGRMTPVFDNLSVFLSALPGPAPDFVLFTGDLTERGDAGDYAALRAFFDRQLPGIPVIATPGNHDDKAAYFEGWLGRPAGAGRAHTVTDVGGLAVIALDSAAPGFPDGSIDASCGEWLREALASLGQTPALLITHHHLLPGQYEIPEAAGAAALAGIVADAGNLLGVFCGHTHHNYTGWFGGRPYFTADGLSFVSEPAGDGNLRFEERSAAAAFCLEDGRFSVRRLPVVPVAKELARLDVSALKDASSI